MDKLTTASVAADVMSAAFQHGINQGFWKLIEQIDNRVYINICARDQTWFLLELECTDYGKQAILGRFVDVNNRECIASAWPRGNGLFEGWIKFNPGNLFICWDQDRKGIEHHYGEWFARQAWKKGKNQIIAYIEHIHHLLWLPKYGYEGKAA